MDKLKEALKKLLPEDQISEVSAAVDEMLNEAKAQLEKEYNSKLEEAYAELSNELAAAEKTAETGYQEAYQIISELRNRLEVQGEEYKAALEEGYDEAYKLIKTERDKNNTLEVDMYEEYENKLKEMKEYIVDKVDQFLQNKGAEIYEQAKRDVLNDPRMAEHKVALDRIVDITANYLSDEDYAVATSTKLDEVNKTVEELKGQMKILEARNIRLSTENTKLNENFRKAQADLLTEQKHAASDRKHEVITEQKERVEKAKNVTGRGTVTTEDTLVIAENNGNGGGFDESILQLAGVKKAN
jgi:hypothetical protein